jgi:hypothetical protein
VANKKITELTEVTSAGANDVLAVVDIATPETKKIKVSNLKTSLNIQKSDVGLGNVDNTSDADKPVSTATQTALDLKANSADVYTKTESDSNFEAKNANIQSHISSTSNPHSVTKDQVGLANVDNTSDASKPVSTATQTALNAKQATITGAATTIASSNLTVSRALASDASGKVAVSAVTSTELGYLSGVTSAIQTQFGAKANLASPALTGTPTAPTAVSSTNTTQIATTAFVQSLLSPTSSTLISALNIDWSLADVFYKDISTSSTFTFSNIVDGKGISVILTNTSASSVTVLFPSGIFKESGIITIAANSAAVYSFIRANAKTYLASLSNLTNA